MARRNLIDGLFGLGVASLALAGQITRFDGDVAFAWAPSALGIAALVAAPGVRWPTLLALLAAAIALAGSLGGAGSAHALSLALGSMIEVWAGAAILRRHGMRGDEVLRDFAAYCGAIGLVAPGLAALVIVAAQALMLQGPLGEDLADVFIAHALGNVIFMPVFTLIAAGGLLRWLRAQSLRSMAELAAVVLVVAIAGYAAFAQTRLPLLVLPVLAAVMATYRFDRVGASLSVMVLALIGSVLTLRGIGPMVVGSGGAGPKVQLLQAYLAVIVLCVQPLARDVARRSRLELALKETAALYRLLAEHSTDAILKTDREGRIAYASPAAAAIGDRLPGRLLVDLAHPAHAGHLMAQHRAAIERGPVSGWTEYLLRDGAGANRWFEVQTHPLTDELGQVYGAVSILRNIDERKAFEERLFEAGLTDPLTGLSNRRAFITMLDHAIAEEVGGCLALFDLDHFKAVNDRHGHVVGDKVLVLFAELLRTQVRNGDTAARIGGEKFAAILPRATPDQAEAVSLRILSGFSSTTRAIDGAIVRCTASAGVSALAGSADETLRAADLALYLAKAKGRDRLEMATRTVRRW